MASISLNDVDIVKVQYNAEFGRMNLVVKTKYDQIMYKNVNYMKIQNGENFIYLEKRGHSRTCWKLEEPPCEEIMFSLATDFVRERDISKEYVIHPKHLASLAGDLKHFAIEWICGGDVVYRVFICYGYSNLHIVQGDGELSSTVIIPANGTYKFGDISIKNIISDIELRNHMED